MCADGPPEKAAGPIDCGARERARATRYTAHGRPTECAAAQMRPEQHQARTGRRRGSARLELRQVDLFTHATGLADRYRLYSTRGDVLAVPHGRWWSSEAETRKKKIVETGKAGSLTGRLDPRKDARERRMGEAVEKLTIGSGTCAAGGGAGSRGGQWHHGVPE
ncbi:hypothetical protein BC834DRAFT_180314 [Gloeopeniophorella convolvens]|nr:hypothetical protein BC834DRAFT_180314 [Gloeopeniophorella convolvens]